MRAPPVRPWLGRREHDLLEGAALGRELDHAHPGRDQQRVEVGGSSTRTSSAVRRRAARPGRRAARGPCPTSGVRTYDAAGRPLQRLELAPGAPAVRGRARRRGCTSARPRRAGGWTGRSSCPAALSASSSSRISRMPCGSRPLVGSSRTSSVGPPQQRGGQAESLPHAERVGPHRPAVDAAEPDLVEHVVDAAGPVRRAPPGPMASKSARFARPDRWAYAAGPSTSAPTWGSTGRAAAAASRSPSSSISPRGGQHQAEQHPHGRGLARAVGAEEPVDVALAHVEVEPSTARIGPNRLVSPAVRIIGPTYSRSLRRARGRAVSSVSWVTVPAISQPPP